MVSYCLPIFTTQKRPTVKSQKSNESTYGAVNELIAAARPIGSLEIKFSGTDIRRTSGFMLRDSYSMSIKSKLKESEKQMLMIVTQTCTIRYLLEPINGGQSATDAVQTFVVETSSSAVEIVLLTFQISIQYFGRFVRFANSQFTNQCLGQFLRWKQFEIGRNI